MAAGNHPRESDRRLVTVMFADISGFTAMSEKMDPEEVTEIMNECFRCMGGIIEAHGGTIDKFIGDCIMALFGALRALEDGPQRAIDTALEMRERLKRFNEEKKLPLPLSFHIGLNSGTVIAGMVGCDSRQDFTVMGDTVNLASRMESAAAKDGILVSENTYRLARGYFDFESIGELKVKGKELPVKAYLVLGPRRAITRIDTCSEIELSPFVGRGRELELLGERFALAGECRGQVVGIVGEPGVGKSRLVRQFRESLDPEENTFIEGGCINFGSTIPYLPILDMLRDFFKISEKECEADIKKKIRESVFRCSDKLDHTIAPLYDVLSLAVDDEAYMQLNGRQRQARVFEAIRLLLAAESMKKPLVVVIEDLHWMDTVSEQFLTHLVNSIATARIMLVLLYRPEYNHSWAGKSYYTRIGVDQMPALTIAELVKSILKCRDAEQDLIDFIGERTGGNPLFIEEMTCNLHESGAIGQEGGRYFLSREPGEIQVPSTIHGIIAARLDRLEDAHRRIMQAASVIGREFAFRILQALDSTVEDLQGSLLTLQDLEFIYEKAFLPELEYIFKHALTRDVAYNSLLIKKRKETHEQVGRAIEEIYGDRIEEFYEMLAHHYSLGDNTVKASQFFKLSGEKARKNYANREAVWFYREAVRTLEGRPDDEETLRFKFKCLTSVMALMNLLGYPEDLEDVLREAERIALALDDEKCLTSVYSVYTLYYAQKGRQALSMEYSKKSFYLAEKMNDAVLMARNASAICTMNYNFGNLATVVEFGEKALKAMEEIDLQNVFGGGVTIFSLISGHDGCALGWMGYLDDARKRVEKGLLNAHASNDKYGVAWNEFMHSAISYIEGDLPSVFDHARKAVNYLEEAEIAMMTGLGRAMLAQGYYHQGNHGAAVEHAERAIELQKKAGMPFILAWAYWHLGMIYSDTGNLQGALDSAWNGFVVAYESDTKIAEAVSRILIGHTLGKMDAARSGEAHEIILSGISMLDERKALPVSAMGHIYLGEFLAGAGRKDEAVATLNEAQSMYEGIGVTPASFWLKRIRAAIAALELAQ